jgi:hypothetical protein
VGTGGGALNRGALLLTQSARYPVIAAAIAGPDAGELTVLVLSGKPGPYGSWSKVAVERVSAVTGSLLGVEYRASGLGGDGQQPGAVGIISDPSGRYLLLAYGGHGGRYTGWIEHRGLRFLPLKDPNPRLSITAW